MHTARGLGCKGGGLPGEGGSCAPEPVLSPLACRAVPVIPALSVQMTPGSLGSPLSEGLPLSSGSPALSRPWTVLGPSALKFHICVDQSLAKWSVQVLGVGSSSRPAPQAGGQACVLALPGGAASKDVAWPQALVGLPAAQSLRPLGFVIWIICPLKTSSVCQGVHRVREEESGGGFCLALSPVPPVGGGPACEAGPGSCWCGLRSGRQVKLHASRLIQLPTKL